MIPPFFWVANSRYHDGNEALDKNELCMQNFERLTLKTHIQVSGLNSSCSFEAIELRFLFETS